MNYTRSNLKTTVNSRIFNKIGIISDINTLINDAVTNAYTLVDFRSSKRKSTVAPNLFNDIYQYNCPTDMKSTKIIDLQPQTMEREYFNYWELVVESEFDRRKIDDINLISFTDRDFTRKLLVSAELDDDGLTVAPLDTLTGGGSWAAFGDAENLSVDSNQFVKGSGSIKFDIDASGGTTAGIEASDVPTFDLSNYESDGSAFVWAWITDATDITNYILRIGNDSSNYYEMTATSTNESTAFVAGWNLIRFDFSGKTTTGTVTDTAGDYVALYMTKAATKVSETDYRFDHIILRKGVIHNLIYYSKFPWQNSSGTYLVNSTDDTDFINADEDEITMIIEKIVEWASYEVRESASALRAAANFRELRREYRKTHRSEALQTETTYYNI